MHIAIVAVSSIIRLISVTLGASVNGYLVLKGLTERDFRRMYPLEVNIVSIGALMCGVLIPLNFVHRLSLVLDFSLGEEWCLASVFWMTLTWSNICLTIFFVSLHRIIRVRRRMVTVRIGYAQIIEIILTWVLGVLISSFKVTSYAQMRRDLGTKNETFFEAGCIPVQINSVMLFEESLLLVACGVMLIAIIVCWLAVLLAIRVRQRVEPVPSLSSQSRKPTIRKGVTSISDTVIKISLPGIVHEERHHESEFDIEIKSRTSEIHRINSFNSEEDLENAFDGSYTESINTNALDETAFSDMLSEHSSSTRTFCRRCHSPKRCTPQKGNDKENKYSMANKSRRKSSPLMRRCRFSRSHSDMNPLQIRSLMKKLHERAASELSPKIQKSSCPPAQNCHEKRHSFHQCRRRSSKYLYTQERISSKCPLKKARILKRSYSSGDFWSKAENFKSSDNEFPSFNLRSKNNEFTKSYSSNNDGLIRKMRCDKSSSSDSRQANSSERSSEIREIRTRKKVMSFSDTKTTSSNDSQISPVDLCLKSRRKTNIRSWSEITGGNDHSWESPTDIYVQKRTKMNVKSYSDTKSLLSSEKSPPDGCRTTRCPRDSWSIARKKIRSRQLSSDSRPCPCCETSCHESRLLSRPDTSMSISSGLELHLTDKCFVNKSFEEKEGFTETSLSLKSISTNDIEDMNNAEKCYNSQKSQDKIGIFLSPEIPEYKFSDTSFTPSEKVKFWKQKIIEDLDEDEADTNDYIPMENIGQGIAQEIPVEIKIIRPSTAGNQIVSRRNAFTQEFPIIEHLQNENREERCSCDRQQRFKSIHTISASESVSKRMIIAMFFGILMMLYLLLYLIQLNVSDDLSDPLEITAVIAELVFAMNSYLYVLYNKNIKKVLARERRLTLPSCF